MNRSALATFSLATAVAVMTLGYANPSYAAKPCIDDDTHPSCKNDDDSRGGGATFSVDIGDPDLSELLQGGSGDVPWAEGVVGKNAIGLNDASGDDVGTLTGLSMFSEFVGIGAVCFPGDFLPVPTDPPPDPPAPHDLYDQLHQAFIKPGKKGRAEANFWFHGKTFEGDVRVLYVLKLFGKFEPGMVWPGTQTLKMDKWELKVENEGKTIKGISCLGAGDLGAETTPVITIKVTAL